MADSLPALEDLPRVVEESLTAQDLPARLLNATTPFVVRGLAAHWPLVQAGAEGGATAACDYLARLARDRAFPANLGQSAGDDRLFYDAAMGMNFRMANGRLDAFLQQMLASEENPALPVVYLSSIDMNDYFSGLAEANRLELGPRRPLESIWIGNRTRIAAHNDVPDNLAVCAVGKRRFTLFPPEQFRNLYLGPLENTPAGRPVSMVDFRAPDWQRYPRFREALATATIAELAPGDALFVPSLWWHHVEGLAPFNVLVNYWWRNSPAFLGQPEDALLHGILALRDLPAAERQQWRELFDHYVFHHGPESTDHLPEEGRGILAPLTAGTASRLRARLLRGLSR